jgi:hypothetical protein
MHVHVPCDPGPGGAAKVHAEIQPIGRINVPQNAFHLLA